MKHFLLTLFFSVFVASALALECHEPDVEASASVASLAADICAMDELLSRSPPNFKAASVIYSKGRHSMKETLEEAALTRFECPTWRLFALGNSGPGWMHEFLRDALKGYLPFDTEIARAQYIKTFLRSGLLSQRCIYHLEISGAKLLEDNVEEAIMQWDYSMAAFYGADVDCAVFGDGVAVGRDFRTKDPSLTDINLKIAQMYKAGRDAIDADDMDGLNVAIDEIRRNIFIIYTRAIIKSTILMGQAHQEDKSFAKFQGDGFAFLNGIAAGLNHCAEGGVSPEGNITRFLVAFPFGESASENVERIVEAAKCLGISSEDLGEFVGRSTSGTMKRGHSRSRPFRRSSAKSNSCYNVNPWADFF